MLKGDAERAASQLKAWGGGWLGAFARAEVVGTRYVYHHHLNSYSGPQTNMASLISYTHPIR